MRIKPTAPEAVAPEPAPAASAEVLYRNAEQALRGGDVTHALALLDEVVSRFPNDPLALAAVYESATVLRDRVKDPARAHASFQRYLALAPRGPLWREARLGLCQTSSDDACLRELVSAADAGWAALEAELLRARRAEEAGHLEAAAHQYAALLKRVDVTPRILEDAWMGRARALMQLGKKGQARQLLIEYLERFPNGRYADEAKVRTSGQAP